MIKTSIHDLQREIIMKYEALRIEALKPISISIIGLGLIAAILTGMVLLTIYIHWTIREPHRREKRP